MATNNTLTEIEQFYENHPNNIKGSSFIKNYLMPMRRLLNLALETKNFKGTMVGWIELIETNPEFRTANTRQFYLRTLLFFMGEYRKKKDLQLIINSLEKYKVEAKMSPNTVPYIPYSDIEAAVLKKFGAISMEYLFIKLFYQQPARLE